MSPPPAPRLAPALLTCAALVLALAPPAHPYGTKLPNILIVLLDDVGVDLLGAYGEHPEAARTPVIDGLAQKGLLFRNAWSTPSCFPTRSTLLTGRQAFRTGMGFGTNYVLGTTELSVDEVTLADVVRDTHQTFAIGKWHQASALFSGPQHPLLLGFDHHLGPMSNVPGTSYGNGYFEHDKNVDGVLVPSTLYATTEQVDDALPFVAENEDPWLLYLSFTAPHAPWHAPPDHLHTYDLPPQVQRNEPIHARAMTEAVDTELGRLLDGIDAAVLANTYILVMGDNGTSRKVTLPPFDPDHAKTTLYEGGINVPLLCVGPGIPPGHETAGLVNLTDIFATVAELTGHGDVTAEDSVSLVPYFQDPGRDSLRPWVYCERFRPNGFVQPHDFWTRAVRDERYKVIRRHRQSLLPDGDEFYDLLEDPFETTDLLEGPLGPTEQAAYDGLTAVLDQLMLEEAWVPWVDLGLGKDGSSGPVTLTGTGLPMGGETTGVDLAGAPPGAPGLLIVSLERVDEPFYGGTLVPAWPPVGSSQAFVTDGSGQVSFSGPLPLDLPADLVVYWQAWLTDAGVDQGVASSAALRSVTL